MCSQSIEFWVTPLSRMGYRTTNRIQFEYGTWYRGYYRRRSSKIIGAVLIHGNHEVEVSMEFEKYFRIRHIMYIEEND